MKPWFLAWQFGKPPAVLGMNHLGVDSIIISALLSHPALLRFYPNPITVFNPELSCCLGIDLGHGVRTFLTKGFDLAMLGVVHGVESAAGDKEQRIFLG